MSSRSQRAGIRSIVARNANGCLEIFAWSRDGRLKHAWQGTAGGDFGSWEAFG